MLELTLYRDQKRSTQTEYENGVFNHLAFEVKDMEKVISTIWREGITIMDEPFRLSSGGSLIAFIEDPDRTLIELIGRK
jgi:predicted enzyme related to lactoylglutathione lyase